jgi:hypothetical protein
MRVPAFGTPFASLDTGQDLTESQLHTLTEFNMTNQRYLCSLISMFLVAAALTACDEDNPADDFVQNAMNTEVPTSEEVVDAIKEEVQDRIDCSGYAREETRNLITAAITNQDVSDLVSEPAEVARLVGAVAVTTNTTALLVGNLLAMLKVGHLSQAATGQWDALTCDSTEDFECEDALTGQKQGSGSTTVGCNDGVASKIAVEFRDGCQLSGTENNGAFEFLRTESALRFAEFTLGSVKKMDGDVTVNIDNGAVTSLEILTGSPLVISANAGKSCEERLTFRKMVATELEDRMNLALDIEKLADGSTYGIRTLENDAAWSKSLDCPCPIAMSGFDLLVPKPLGLADETATLRFTYGESASDDHCSEASVEVVEWPQSCGEVGPADCGKAAIGNVLSSLVSATCVAF